MKLEVKEVGQVLKEVKLTGRLDQQGSLAIDSQFTIISELRKRAS